MRVRGSRWYGLPWHYLVLAAWAARWFDVYAADQGGKSWHLFTAAGRLLFGGHPAGYGAPGGLRLFASYPKFQFGPVTLAVAAALRPLGPDEGLVVAQLLMTGCGLAILVVAEYTARAVRPDLDPDQIRWTVLGAGLVFWPVWEILAVSFMHLDDVLALLLAVLSVASLQRGRIVAVGVLLALSAGAKPWAFGFMALLFALPGKEAKLRGLAWAVGVTAVLWGPFVIADPGSVAAAHYAIPNVAVSGLRALGVDSVNTPPWDRAAQILLGLGLSLIAVRRGRWPAVLLICTSVRLALDPNNFPYYDAGPVVGALIWDLMGARRAAPVWTLAAGSLFWAWTAVPGREFVLSGDLRVGFAVAVAAYTIVAPAHVVTERTGIALLRSVLVCERVGVGDPVLCKPAVGVPEHVVTMEETLAVVRRLHADHPRLDLALRLISNTGVLSRHLVQPLEVALRHPGFEERNLVHEREARRLVPPVIRQALFHAELSPSDIDALIYVSCTGFMMPSMTAWLINNLGFRPDCRQLPIAQLGCAAGGAAINRAHDLCLARPGSNVLIVSCEFCSLCYQPGDVDIGSLLSDGLFGDGVAACVVRGAGGYGVGLCGNGSYLIPGTEDWISFAVKSTGFHFLLDRRVPHTMEQLAPVLRDLAGSHGLDSSSLDFYIVHAGGPRILDDLCRFLGVGPDAFRHSRATLTSYGNIASAVVLDALRRLFDEGGMTSGATGIVAGFGPGITAEMAVGSWVGAPVGVAPAACGYSLLRSLRLYGGIINARWLVAARVRPLLSYRCRGWGWCRGCRGSCLRGA